LQFIERYIEERAIPLPRSNDLASWEEDKELVSKDFSEAASHPSKKLAGSALTSLTNIRPLYFLPIDPLAEEVLIPGFRAAEKVDCMVGFFSSSVLAQLAPGLAAYIAIPDHRFRLIMSPFLRPEDRKAMEEGTRAPEDIASELLQELIVTEDFLEQHTLRCFSYLLRTGRIDIRIALMKDALFHPKVWIFEQNGKGMAAHGSSNLTRAGIRKNFEQVSVSKSWEDPNQRYTVEKFQNQFSRLWEGKEDDCAAITINNGLCPS